MFHRQYFCHYVHFLQFLLQVYSNENINKYYNLTSYVVFACFFPSKERFIFVSSDCFLVKLTSFCLNPNLVLHLCAAVVLQSIITLVISSFSITIFSDCFLIHLLVHIYVFCGLKDISLGSHSIFYDLILIPFLSTVSTSFLLYVSLHISTILK